MSEIMNKIADDINNIYKYSIETTKAFVVPTRDDTGLTFPIGADKKGKLIETCVLMIDIRNSTKISNDLRNDKIHLGKIYSAFIHSMASIADEYGFVRNIIGDRVMVVFEPNDCFTKAVECAADMYTISRFILAKKADRIQFSVGIGIDYGEMLVLKSGIPKKNEERSEYKNLVWIGNTANIASKICDHAGKTFHKKRYNITYDHIYTQDVPLRPNGLLGLLNSDLIIGYEKKYYSDKRTATIDHSEIYQKLKLINSTLYYGNCKVTKIDEIVEDYTTSPILLSGKVYKEYIKANPKSIHKDRISHKNYSDLPATGSGIYGGALLNIEYLKSIRGNKS